MDLQLEGKTALVSGSTVGIGFAIAEGLAREGVAVVINGRTEERVTQAVKLLQTRVPNASVQGVVADLGTVAGSEIVFHQVGKVDILVNNLGIYSVKPFSQLTDAEWTQIFEVNVMSGVRLSRHYLPSMLSSNWGRILFISSESGVAIPQEMIHYGVSKTAQIALARGIAETTQGTGVTVNTILPGPTLSEGVENFVTDVAKSNGKTREEMEAAFFTELRPGSLIKRFASPQEVASLVVFAASPRASAINGAALRVEGGLLRSIL